MDNLTLLINVISGGAVGYATNSLAINMLFEKYPLIGGGAILKEREKLEIAMSDLIENELVKPASVINQIEKENFKFVFDDLVIHIIENAIDFTIKEIDSINNLDGYHKTSENIQKFLIEKKEAILKPCLEILYSNLSVEDALSEKQLLNIIDNLYDIILKNITQKLELILNDFINEFGEVKLFDLIEKQLLKDIIWKQLSDNLFDSLENKLLENFDIFITKTILYFNIETTIQKIEEIIKEKTFFEILGEPDTRNISKHLLNRLKNFLITEKGEKIIYELIDSIFNLLSNLEIPLSSFLNESLEKTLLTFLENNLTDLVEKFEKWVIKNKFEIDFLINSSVEQYLGSENVVKKLIVNIFARKISERYKVVEKGIKEAKKLVYTSESEFIEIIKRFLDNANLKDLMGYLKNIINSEFISKFILTYLKNISVEKMDLKILDELFSNKISNIQNIFQINLNDTVMDFLDNYASSYFKDKLTKNHSIRNNLKQIVLEFIDSFEKDKLKNLLHNNTEDLIEIINEASNNESIKKTVINLLSKEINQLTKGKKLDQLISSNLKNNIEKKLGLFYVQKMSDVLAEIEQEKVENLYEKLMFFYEEIKKDNKSLKEANKLILKKIVDLVRDSNILEGKISATVNESWKRLSENEMKDELKAFMGNQLYPITLLGAFLGANVGAVLFFTSLIPSVNSYTTGIWGLFTAPIVYGATGVFTNWLAIKMVFKPYEKKFIPIINLRVPFTPGLFPSRKQELGENLANFVDNRILSKDTIKFILTKYEKNWITLLKDFLGKENYQIIDDFIGEYRNDIFNNVIPSLLDLGFDQVNKNKETIAKYITQEFKKLDLNQIDLNFAKEEFSKIIFNSRKYIKSYLEEIVSNKIINSNKTIGDYLDSNKSKKIVKFTTKAIENKLINFTNEIKSTEYFDQLIKNISDKLDSQLDTNIIELFEPIKFQDLKSIIANFIKEKLRDKEIQISVIKYLKNNFIDESINSDKKIGEIFSGKIIETLIKESDFIMSYISDYAINLSQEKKEEFIKGLIKEVENQGLLETMMVRIGGIENDIRGVINLILDEKIKPYMDYKKSELQILFNNYVKDELANKKLSDLNLENLIDPDNLLNFLQNNFSNNKNILEIINKLTEYLIDDIFTNLSIRDTLEMINIKSIYDLSTRFSNETKIIKNAFINGFLENKDNLMKYLSNTIDYLLNENIYDIKINTIFKNIDQSMISKSINKSVDVIYDSSFFDKTKNNLINSIFEDLKTKKPQEIINFETLKIDLSKTISNLTEQITENNPKSANFQNDIKIATEDLLNLFVEIMKENVELETKEAILDVLIKTVFFSLEANSEKLAKPIQVKKIVRKEVMKMNAASIEKMFDFAKPIFNTLISYGAIGGIVGLGIGIIGLL